VIIKINAVKNFNAVPYYNSTMSQQKPLIVKISSSLSTAMFDCGINSNWQKNVYLTSTVKLNLVKFHSGTIMLTPHTAGTCSAMQLLI